MKLEVRVLLSIFFHKKNDDPRALNGRTWLGRWLLLVCLSCVLGWMPRAGAEDLAVPELSGWVVDEAQVLTGEQRQALDQMLQQFEQQKGAQIFMLTLPSLKGEDIDSYAVRVFEDWGVGRQATDDGVLLVAAIEDRKLRIEVGYGLEGVIPDIVAGRIIREQIAPAFQQEAYAQGLMAAATQLMQRIEAEDLPAPESSEGATADDGPEGMEILIILAILFGFAFLVPPVPAAAAVGIFVFTIFEALGWAVGAAMVAFLISSVGSLWRFGPDSDTRYASGNRSAARRRHDHWGGGGFGGGGGMGGGGIGGGGGASGGGGSSGGGGASGGW